MCLVLRVAAVELTIEKAVIMKNSVFNRHTSRELGISIFMLLVIDIIKKFFNI